MVRHRWSDLGSQSREVDGLHQGQSSERGHPGAQAPAGVDMVSSDLASVVKHKGMRLDLQGRLDQMRRRSQDGDRNDKVQMAGRASPGTGLTDHLRGPWCPVSVVRTLFSETDTAFSGSNEDPRARSMK